VSQPLVSVVIPTINRPGLVLRAVNSVLAQTLGNLELIVVIDGPDADTVRVLEPVTDHRVCVVVLPDRRGYGGAVNAGVAQARGPWIALLDDDDVWMPRKLEMQLEAARQSAHRHPLVACRFIARTDHGDMVWPLREPDPGEPFCEYLWCQRGVRGGDGAVLPSGLLTTRALMLEVPWRPGLPRLNDFDWYLRISQVSGFGLVFPDTRDPLAVYSCGQQHTRLSTSGDWRYCLDWLRANRHLVTPRAYAAFALTVISTTAARDRDLSACVFLLGEAFRHGRPRLTDLLAHASIWLLPPGVRIRINVVRDRLRERRHAHGTAEAPA
jgi:glycosyltransferase involved in cell wall biosynthesis